MTGMEDVLAAHQFNHKGAVCTCSNEVQVGLPCDAQTHPQHVAEVLTAAGFGNLHDAWAEGHRTTVQRERSGCGCGAWSENECACGKYGTGKIITPNPYPAPKVSET